MIYHFKNKNNTKKGFTLLELLVVSSIFTVVTSLVLVKFSLFNNTILTTNLAYDIALSIRQAQTFGLNVKGFGSGTSVVFDTGYGVHFASASNNSYILFADLNKNKKYSSNELIESFSIKGGHIIEKFCASVSGSSQICSDEFGGPDDLDVVFTRPDPDAVIKSYDPEVTYQSATIRVRAPQGVRREIKVYSTGQIAIVAHPE